MNTKRYTVRLLGLVLWAGPAASAEDALDRAQLVAPADLRDPSLKAAVEVTEG